MHAQNFARAVKLIDHDQMGDGCWVALHMGSGDVWKGSISPLDGVFVWLTTDDDKARRILVDVNYVEAIEVIDL